MRSLLTSELGNGFSARHLWLLALFPILCAGLTIWFPTFPKPIYDFHIDILRLEGWSDIILLNVYTGLFFVLYWFGVFDVLKVYVTPFEERYLTLILSKPVRRSTYMAARLIPTFSILALAGGLGSAATLLTLELQGLETSYAAATAGCATTVALAIAMVALVNFIILSVPDTYAALGVAFLPMFVFFVPPGVFLYRPDVFDANPAMRELLVFPANLLWNDEVLARQGWPIAAGFLVVAAVLALLAAWRLVRKDLS